MDSTSTVSIEWAAAAPITGSMDGPIGIPVLVPIAGAVLDPMAGAVIDGVAEAIIELDVPSSMQPPNPPQAAARIARNALSLMSAAPQSFMLVGEPGSGVLRYGNAVR
jgi:hypothetical protein